MKTLNQVVPVDYYMPGCPPESAQITAVVRLVIAALQGRSGAAAGRGRDRRRDKHRLRRMQAQARGKDHHRVQAHGHLPAQHRGMPAGTGHPVRGPGDPQRLPGALSRRPTHRASAATAPPPGVVDQGARMLSAVASVVGSNDPEEIDKILGGIVDPAGTFYRFSLASSLLHRAHDAGDGGSD